MNNTDKNEAEDTAQTQGDKGGCSASGAVTHRAQYGSSVWLECVIRIEHGWLCIRNRAGWLLWSAKAKEVDTHQGVVLSDIEKELTARPRRDGGSAAL